MLLKDKISFIDFGCSINIDNFVNDSKLIDCKTYYYLS